VDLVIVGAGGLGRECLDTALALELSVRCFIDDHRAGEQIRGLPVVTPADLGARCAYLVGIADPVARRRLSTQLDELGWNAVTLVHPTATVAPETSIGAGSLVMGGAYISSSVAIGQHSQVQYTATVGHDSTLGDHVTVLPGANVSGSVTIEEDATVGSGAVVLQGRRVGAGAFVGAGAVVTRDVAPGEVVVGSPARPLHTGPR
jgi:sugar O-acyltransferase (sialic acid O-acetyltransferase NeuD family)